MHADDTLTVLNDLIQTSEDGKKGFADAAEVATNPELKTMFQGRSADCDTAVTELQQLVQSLGGTPADSGTVVGAANRGWAKMKTSVGDPNLGMLEEIERAEDRAKAAYINALNVKLPQLIEKVVQRQYEGAIRNHNIVRDLRNSYRAAAKTAETA